MTGEDLIGTWRLQSFAFTDMSGAVVHPLGELVAGYVLISAEGYLALNFMAGERSRFDDDDLFGGSTAERARATATSRPRSRDIHRSQCTEDSPTVFAAGP